MRPWRPMILIAASLLAGCSNSLQRYGFKHRQMGIIFKVVLYAPSETAANNAAGAAFDRIDELNGLLSDWDATSELSRLSATSGAGQKVPVSKPLWHMLETSRRWSAASSGAFDITVGPAVKLWRRARVRRQMPTAKELAAARAAIGYEKIRLNPDGRTAELAAPHMRLDLGGIAKGYAADEAIAIMKARGIDRALVDAGGDMRLGAAPPGKPGWRVELRPLTGNHRNVRAGYLVGQNLAVATSGDFYRFTLIEGVRYSHIVDPRTALGLRNSSSVTVIAPDGTTADALASAISVMRPDAGVKLVDGLDGVGAIVVQPKADGSLAVHRSKGLSAFKIEKP